MTLLGATTRSQSGPGSNGITGVSPSDCIVSYAGHSLGKSYPSAEMQLVYSAASAEWASV